MSDKQANSAQQMVMIGLGKMGAGMAARARGAGVEVLGVDPFVDGADAKAVAELLPRLTSAPRVFWMMLQIKPLEIVIEQLLQEPGLIRPGDIVVDGGNSNFRLSIARGELFEAKGVRFVDVGVSGGVWGEEYGYPLMAGGSNEAVAYLAPVLEALAGEAEWAHVGPTGAGHRVKAVHNAIEYVVMHGIAEGFELLENDPDFDFDLKQIAHLWNGGSVIRSWLLELFERALTEDPHLEKISGYVDDTGEGRWTLKEAIDAEVPAPALAIALFARFSSRQDDSFTAKGLAAMRNQFGGHALKLVETTELTSE
jgi:6-phosphogluconate dehydrogenase